MKPVVVLKSPMGRNRYRKRFRYRLRKIQTKNEFVKLFFAKVWQGSILLKLASKRISGDS